MVFLVFCGFFLYFPSLPEFHINTSLSAINMLTYVKPALTFWHRIPVPFIWKVPFDFNFVIWTYLASQSCIHVGSAWHWHHFFPLEVCPATDFNQRTPGSTPQALNPPKTSLMWQSSTNKEPEELTHRTSTSDASVWNSLLGSTCRTWMSVLDFCRGRGVFLPPSKSSSLKKKELEKWALKRTKKKKNMLEREYLELLVPWDESFQVWGCTNKQEDMTRDPKPFRFSRWG